MSDSTAPPHGHSAKAKIVATLGPASSSPEIIRHLIEAGADAFRLNFSHGTPDGHCAMAAAVRKVAGDNEIAIIADLQGPRIRIGSLPQPVTVRPGDEVRLAGGSAETPPGVLPTTYEPLARDLRAGGRVLIDNGLIELLALESDGRTVRCRVVTGGQIGSNKGINLPGVAVSAPALTPKDEADVVTAIELGADYIALSFVRSPDDVRVLRNLLRSRGADIPIIAKIERAEAVVRMDEVIDAADAVMVARGDLGVELPQEKVPAIQKRLIARCVAASKPVITATEMLQSMIENPRPTRAEASDVANAIVDGTDAVMLSGETAVGRYPVEAVRMMNRIAFEAESIRREFAPAGQAPEPGDFTVAAAEAACTAAEAVGAVAIVVHTISGRTARLVAQHRPPRRIIALTPHEHVRRRMALVWSVTGLYLPVAENVSEMVESTDDLLKQRGNLKTGDVIVIVGGSGPVAGATNFTKLHRVR